MSKDREMKRVQVRLANPSKEGDTTWQEPLVQFSHYLWDIPNTAGHRGASNSCRVCPVLQARL